VGALSAYLFDFPDLLLGAHKMSPVTHFLISWSAGSAAPISKRDRLLVSAVGIAPDVDGLGLVVDLAARDSFHTVWSRYHHFLAHNVTFGMLLLVLAFCFAKRRFETALVAFAVFHLHLVCDFLGSRAPDQIWTIPYLVPFSNHEFSWSGQWPLNSWQNLVITLAFIVFGLYQAWRRGCSPVEAFSARGNHLLVQALRTRFGEGRRDD
jgi:hypothetical protein